VKLRGNLLFYFKGDQFSEPAGVIVLEKYRVSIPNEQTEAFEGYPFYIGKKVFTFDRGGFWFCKNLFSEFEDGLNQRLGATSEQERDSWVQAIRMAGQITKFTESS
jgi:inositol polyphosphate-4-phosphatase